MKRVLLFALCCAAFFALNCRPALAIAEFCPATLTYAHAADTPALLRRQSAIDSVGDAQPRLASLFGIELSAYGPRTIVSAKLAFDTTAGWFTADVPQTALIEKDRHYANASAAFTRHDWITPVMYVRFPVPAAIAHAWVYSITVAGDDMFNWSAQGTVICPPTPGPSKQQARNQSKMSQASRWLDPKDEDHLDVPPGPNSTILQGTASNALGDSSCAEPFREAEVTSQAEPEYPNFLRNSFAGRAQNAVEVAISPDGSIRDAWIWGPSGFTLFDDSTLRAARSSKYSGARAYCQAVPASYLFKVTYDSNN